MSQTGSGSQSAADQESMPDSSAGKDGGSKNGGQQLNGTVAAQRDEDMAHTASNESYGRLIGKNIPDSAKNDSLLGAGRAGVPIMEPGSSATRRGTEFSGVPGVQIGAVAQSMEFSELKGADGAGEVDGVPGSKLSGQVWSAVESFRAQGARDWVVRIRPDQDTSMELRMRMHGDQLVIHARLESGRAEMMLPRWTELQGILADRGIQLQGLESGKGHNPGQGHGNQNNQGQTQENAHDPRQFDQSGSNSFEQREAAERQKQADRLTRLVGGRSGQGAASVGSTGEKPRSSNNGWESWA